MRGGELHLERERVGVERRFDPRGRSAVGPAGEIVVAVRAVVVEDVAGAVRRLPLQSG